MEDLYGGEWRCQEQDDNKIVLKRSGSATLTNPERDGIWDEALNLCGMRIALQTSAERLRDNVDRKIPWRCVEAVWGWLTTTICNFSALLLGNIPLAWCRLSAALHLMVDALSATNQWQRVDNYRPGEIWIRVGLDGVPLWKSHVVACTVAETSKLRDYEPHTRNDILFAPCCAALTLWRP